MGNWIDGVSGLSPGELADGAGDATDEALGGSADFLGGLAGGATGATDWALGGTSEFLGGFADGAGNLTDTALGGSADALTGLGDFGVSGISSTVGDLWSGGTEGAAEGVGNLTGGMGTKILLLGAAAIGVYAYTEG